MQITSTMVANETTLPNIIVKTFFVSLIMVLSITGNLSVLYVVIKNKKLHTAPNYFVCNLALADILYSMIGGTSIVITTVNKRWVLGEFVCDLTGLTNTVFLTSSIWTLIAISVNRYLAIKKPFQINSIYTTKRTFYLILSIWIGALLLSFPPLIGWSEFTSGLNYCTVNSKKHFSYSVVILAVNYIIPSIALVILYTCIFKMFSNNNALQNVNKTNGNTSVCNDRHIVKNNKQMLKSQNLNEDKKI